MPRPFRRPLKLRAQPHPTAHRATHAAPPVPTPPRLLPLGAIAAGFGLCSAAALAQPAPAPPGAASAPGARPETTMQPISVKGKVETDANSVRANTTTIGKGNQDVRDIPQSLTIMTDKLLDDRRVETLKQALHQTGGITFMAAEGGEEDVRLRGFSLQTSGDIYIDGMRDPAFYDRDTFAYDRIEVLRGSASMVFGRGSTGGVVNQVHKQAFLADASEVQFSLGSGEYFRFTGDFNVKTGDSAGLRINVMKTDADQWGNFIDKQGIAVNYLWGIGGNDELTVAGYHLDNHNGINYGMPWLRVSSATTNPSVLTTGLDGRSYYGAASDSNDGNATYGTVGHTRRFAGGGELKTTLRTGYYERDQRASNIRFVNTPQPPSLNGPVFVTPATVLTRGTQNKIQDLHSTYLQSDYSNRFKWFGLNNEILAGLDAATEERKVYAPNVLPVGVTLTKAPTTVGTPDDGGGRVDESLRLKLQTNGFQAKSAGLYLQDLVQVAPMWKVLAGLRYDRLEGEYTTYVTAPTTGQPGPVGRVITHYSRTDGLWSKRFGVLFQPSDTQSYHFSYGTSFNTQGEQFLFDAAGSNTGPEASRNIELGAKLDLFKGRLSLRGALFHSTKYNERNRDSPAGTPIPNYLLSGKRHAVGMDIDIAGRISPGWEVWGSYTFIPVARIDAGNPLTGTTETGELVGQRPSITPRHSGSIWTAYQITDKFRFGGALNARSSQTPFRNPAGIVAPKFVTGDLMAEYSFTDRLGVKVNVLNATDKYYADVLYTAHYVQGAPRTVQATLTARF